MTDFLWDSAASGVVSGFVVAPLDLLTTELNAAASGTTKVSSVGGASGVFTSETNFGQCPWAYCWFKSGGALSLAAGDFISGWFLMSPDGATFEASPPQRNPDFTIPLPASVVSGDLYAADSLVRLPAPDCMVALTNNTSGALSANGNSLICGPVAIQFGEPPPLVGRAWAFFPNEGGEPTNWASVNSGWANKPFQGLHTQTDQADSFWFGTGDTWTPTPAALMMSNQYGTPSSNTIDMGQAANGAYNSTWLSWLQGQASSAPCPITVVRIWQEINGNWFPWSINQTGSTSIDGTPNGSPWPVATIKAAWNNMAAQVRSALPNAKIEWNLNLGGPWTGPNGPGNGTGFDLYPGDTYVDVVGCDFYEKATTWGNAVSGAGVNLNALVSFATTHGKLVGISETATESNDGAFLTSMCAFMDGLGSQAAYISYYDQGPANNGGDTIFSPSDANYAPADRTALNASSFGQKNYIGSL